MGRIDLPYGTELHPGDSIDGQIYPGREWRIQEGAKLIGIGTILEVLPSINEFTT